jgi:hypothetical protein
MSSEKGLRHSRAVCKLLLCNPHWLHSNKFHSSSARVSSAGKHFKLATDCFALSKLAGTLPQHMLPFRAE